MGSINISNSIKRYQMKSGDLRTTLCSLVTDCACSLVPPNALQVDLLREECNKNIDKMGIEIHRLEQVSATPQNTPTSPVPVMSLLAGVWGAAGSAGALSEGEEGGGEGAGASPSAEAAGDCADRGEPARAAEESMCCRESQGRCSGQAGGSHRKNKEAGVKVGITLCPVQFPSYLTAAVC